MTPETDYSAEHRPLAAYAALSGAYFAGAAASLVALRRSGRKLPDSYGVWDLVTVAAASQKISRQLTKDKVTSWLRAPFVRFEETSGHGEVSEEPRGRGLQLALGELLGCPYCVGMWVTTGLGIGLLAAPRLTRFVSFVFAADTAGDFLQLVYSASEGD